VVALLGFTVKNTPDVAGNLDVAEPDSGDFTILGNHRYGVITGCQVTDGGVASQVNVTTGVVVVNGVIVPVAATIALIGSVTAEARFDLVTVNQSGVVGVLQGTANPNPVFPAIPDDRMVLAAVYVGAGVSVITDKRIMLPLKLATAIDNGTIVSVYNTAGTTFKFSISHDGSLNWPLVGVTASGTWLTVLGDLAVRNFQAETVEADNSIVSRGTVVGTNLLRGHTLPIGGVAGGLFQRSDGTLWLWSGTEWGNIAADPTPAGVVVATMAAEADPGWLILDGRVVSQAVSGRLWDKFPQWREGSNFRLPDARNSVLMQAPVGNRGGSSTVTLGTNNMPPHRHNVAANPLTGHTHAATAIAVPDHSHDVLSGGAHEHHVADGGHAHVWADGAGGGAFIAKYFGGTRRLDGPFNDASHPVAVQEVDATTRAATGVEVTSGRSEHTHVTAVGGGHSHTVHVEPSTGSLVGLTEQVVGGGAPISTLPPFLGVNWMIRT